VFKSNLGEIVRDSCLADTTEMDVFLPDFYAKYSISAVRGPDGIVAVGENSAIANFLPADIAA
jgi:hypothetical protein